MTGNWLSVDEIAAQLEVNPDTIYTRRFSTEGRARFFSLGSKWRDAPPPFIGHKRLSRFFHKRTLIPPFTNRGIRSLLKPLTND
jgi:hypothetical protein